MIRRFFALASFAAVLSGCATSSAGLSHAPVAAYRDTVDLTGKLSVNYRKDGQPQSATVGYQWEQTPGRIHVTVTSPLGQTMAVLNVTPGSATLIEANRPPRVAKDLETLTHDALGWQLPVSGLRDWLQGYATGPDGQRFVASPANNNVVTQDGWRLRFVSWQDDRAVVPQPKRIDADRNVDGDDLAIRITVDPA